MQAYFAAYDNHVLPNTKCVSFVQWKKYKQAVVPQHQDIRLVIETVEVEVSPSADEESFVLGQNFKSNRLEERDCKQVVLRQEDRAWKIVKEVTL
ncbi:L,D-transpeptidase Cds6 family protein [Ghiorsea bivora]|uniref:L,D-transpeptidase Cds6 family protein n=1 Tax=Ghiorsea bivora TaxID=1485545 RepID=UPI000571348D|nr:hypothetical protein [Ghiorsea bivora]